MEAVLTLVLITFIVKVSKEKDEEIGYWIGILIIIAVMSGIAFGVKT